MTNNQEIKQNEFGDKFSQDEIPSLLKDKKELIAYWDKVDYMCEDFIKKIAGTIGINISELGNLDDVKELETHVVKIIEQRFDVKFPYIDINY